MKTEKINAEISGIFGLFFEDEPVSFMSIDTSREDTDFRKTFIIEAASGKRYVIKIADNDFTFPDRIIVWQTTAEEYRKLGYYCPAIYCGKDGDFPYIEYGGHRCVAYAEEYAPYTPVENRAAGDDNQKISYEQYKNEIWEMTAKIAAKYFDYTEYPSAYCLFERFCPSDKTYEVLEVALEWKKEADTLPEEFKEQTERIWALWEDNKNRLEKVYNRLPRSVFQADLNSSNILLDESNRFAGIYDFNLCGRDVFLNYLIREDLTPFESQPESICRTLETASRFYTFSQEEKDCALMLYRCLKPLWFNRVCRLKEIKGDRQAVKEFLDETENSLTAEIDFKKHMG